MGGVADKKYSHIGGLTLLYFANRYYWTKWLDINTPLTAFKVTQLFLFFSKDIYIETKYHLFFYQESITKRDYSLLLLLSH